MNLSRLTRHFLLNKSQRSVDLLPPRHVPRERQCAVDSGELVGSGVWQIAVSTENGQFGGTPSVHSFVFWMSWPHPLLGWVGWSATVTTGLLRVLGRPHADITEVLILLSKPDSLSLMCYCMICTCSCRKKIFDSSITHVHAHTHTHTQNFFWSLFEKKSDAVTHYNSKAKWIQMLLGPANVQHSPSKQLTSQ